MTSEQIDRLTTVVILRGLVAPNCRYWEVSDQLEDKSGVRLFEELVQEHKGCPFIPVKMFGKQSYLVTDTRYIEEVLNGSPHTFTVGRFKYRFFQSFMRFNVGVSTGCPWERRRKLNEHVLQLNSKHENACVYDRHIASILASAGPPANFDEFLAVSQRIATRIVFGQARVSKPIFDVLTYANTTEMFEKKDFKIPKRLYDPYMGYMKKMITSATDQSLVGLAREQYRKLGLSQMELVHQIPHWVFPIASSIHTTCTRLLLLLGNHADILRKVRAEITSTYDPNDCTSIYSLKYLRKCILEVLRLNNNVVSLFRTLTEDYTFAGDLHTFRKGTQFLILTNPILRNAKYFAHPDEFIPDRWTWQAEHSKYAAISFSRGPQSCPGKDLMLFIVASFIVHLHERTGLHFKTATIQTNDISHAINPCKISVHY